MNLCTILTMTCALLTGGPSDPPNTDTTKIVVRCKAEAMIRGTSVLLRDVAEIRTSDAELSARVGDIRLASRPALGFNRVFPRGEILRRMVSAGLSIHQVEMEGAEEIIAQPLATVLSAKDVTDVASPVLRAVLDLQSNDVEFQLQQQLKSLSVPPGRYDLALRAELRGGIIRGSSAAIDVQVIVDEDVFKTIPLTYRLHHFVNSLTTARVIQKGETLNEANLTLERTEVSPGSNTHLTEFQLVAGMVAARDIPNQTTLRLADFAKPAVVHRNDFITLIARRGNIEVSTKAIALDDAPLDGRLMVRAVSTNKVTQGVVYAPGIVIVPN